VTAAIAEARNPEQVDAVTAAAEIHLTQSDAKEIGSVAELAA